MLRFSSLSLPVSSARSRLLMGLASMSLAAGCGQEQAPPPPAPQVTVAQPVRRDVQRSVEFTGVTRAVESAEVRARVSGVLESIEFTPSSDVEAGDLLFVIERAPYKAARDGAAAALQSAEAELAQAESDLRRVEQAIRNNAVSEQELDKARAQEKRAQAAVLSARAVLDKAELDYSYTLARSPIAGQVSRNFIDAGNLVGASEKTLLARVNKMQPIYVYFDAPERLVLEIMTAQRAELGTNPVATEDSLHAAVQAFVKLSNETTFGHEGYVDYIDNTVDPTTGTIQLRIACPNEDLAMFPGLFVRVRVMGGASRDAILVDERAIGTDLGGKYVLVVGDGDVVEQRYVELGPKQDDGTFVVNGGLDGTERYIVNGMLRARPGLPVSPMTADQAAAARRSGDAS